MTEGLFTNKSKSSNLSAYSKTNVQLGFQFDYESSHLSVYGAYQLIGIVNNADFVKYDLENYPINEIESIMFDFQAGLTYVFRILSNYLYD